MASRMQKNKETNPMHAHTFSHTYLILDFTSLTNLPRAFLVDSIGPSGLTDKSSGSFNLMLLLEKEPLAWSSGCKLDWEIESNSAHNLCKCLILCFQIKLTLTVLAIDLIQLEGLKEGKSAGRVFAFESLI